MHEELGPITWMADRSLTSLRSGLAKVAPFLADARIVFTDRVVTSDPRFFQGSAVVDGSYLVKFAWSEPPARRLVHEAAVLKVLSRPDWDLPVPFVVASSTAPAMFVTRLVPGEPLTVDGASSLDRVGRSRLAEDLGWFLAALHHPRTAAAGDAGVELGEPEPQADTETLRARFPRLVDQVQGEEVGRWCDWVDVVLARPSDQVLLHGDLHGYNLVWDSPSAALRLVTDFETASVGDPAYDFRYLAGQAATVDLYEAVAAVYSRTSSRTVDIDRVMAWNIRTVLGDALWRSEAGVALPGGGTPSSWMTELSERLRRLVSLPT